MTSRAPRDDTLPLHILSAHARWNTWHLVVPRPGMKTSIWKVLRFRGTTWAHAYGGARQHALLRRVPRKFWGGFWGTARTIEQCSWGRKHGRATRARFPELWSAQRSPDYASNWGVLWWSGTFPVEIAQGMSKRKVNKSSEIVFFSRPRPLGKPNQNATKSRESDERGNGHPKRCAFWDYSGGGVYFVLGSDNSYTTVTRMTHFDRRPFVGVVHGWWSPILSGGRFLHCSLKICL